MAIKPITNTDIEGFRRSAQISSIFSKIGKVVVWLLLFVGSVLFGMPLYMMIAMSLKTKNEIANSSPWAWPQNLTWQNYELVLTNPNVSFMTGFFNTLMISTLATLGVVLSASMVAYPFARLQFRGRDRLFLVLISTMLLPGIVTMIPTYVMYKYVYWINTHYPLWVPAFLGGGAFNIFLIRQFYMGIPRELDEAAILDGSNHWTIFSRIIFPNATAVLTTVGIFSFMWSWRDFFSQLIYLNSPDKQTLEIVLRSYQALNDQQWDLLMAASVLVMLPLMLMFLFGQKYILKSMVMSGFK